MSRTKNLKWCKQCQNTYQKAWSQAHPAATRWRERKSRLKRFYGLSVEAYIALLQMQNGVCAICLRPETDQYQTHGDVISELVVDHDHITNQVRGLLCHRCNRTLGLLRDDPDILRRAVTYLETPR